VQPSPRFSIGVAEVTSAGESRDIASMRRAASLPPRRARFSPSESGACFPNDTPANREMLTKVANDPGARLGTDKFGNTWAARVNENGTHVGSDSKRQDHKWWCQRDAANIQF
jgi:hypothetical protein